MLKGIPKGTTFILRVVEPLKAGFGKQIFSNFEYILMMLSCDILREKNVHRFFNRLQMLCKLNSI